MSTSASPAAQRGLILVFAVAIVALLVDLVVTITGASAWSAFIVGLVAFLAGAAIWLAHRRQGNAPPLMFAGWMLCLSALAWSIGLLAG